MTKKLELIFAPGCFDSFEGTPDELAELIAELRTKFENGTLLDNAEPISDDEVEELLNRPIEPRQ
jgi:hypothetical protein